MASLPQEIDGWPTFSPTTPHFFKIILKGNTSSDAKLRIPKKFLMKYGDDLSNPVSLELPSGSGSAWKVDLRRLDGEEMEETDDTDDDFHEDSSDDSVEEQPDDSTCPRKTRKKSSLPCPRPQKKNRSSSRGKDDYPAKLGSGSVEYLDCEGSKKSAQREKREREREIAVCLSEYIN
ncbi:hypothetical protein L3X38_039158 [Prunus dulcis]|uniref:Uncharacterized protein n=1 Tax=Prunus dulcis TaxID=3755 RepID=A0AAD4YS69_PRUDU|nr:hypothetical protein L3X38_039158 [Prunus dulcis]